MKKKYTDSVLSECKITAVLMLVIFVLASCIPISDTNDVEEYATLTIIGEAPVVLDGFYGSYDDGHLYVSAYASSPFRQIKCSLFDYSLGETGTFQGEDYHTTTDCVDLSFDGAYTSGEYKGNNPESFSLIAIVESGEVLKGGAEGIVERSGNPNETLNFTVEFLIKLDDKKSYIKYINYVYG